MGIQERTRVSEEKSDLSCDTICPMMGPESGDKVTVYLHVPKTSDGQLGREGTLLTRKCVEMPEDIFGHHDFEGFPGGTVVKSLPANAGSTASIPGPGRSSRGGHGNPLQCSCLEDSVDKGAWWATVHGVAKSQTWFSDWAHTSEVLWRSCCAQDSSVPQRLIAPKCQ